MNPARFALKNRTVMVVLLLVLGIAGVMSYERLGKLEDPTFTIKTALIITQYPGASPLEVEQEVTDVVEEAIQALGQVKEIRSTSMAGASYVYVDIKDSFKSWELPQIWDELRRKVNDAQGGLPPGAGPSVVQDDFGDVYGVFFALTGEGYSYAELEDYADSLKNDLLLCDGVARIDLWGVRQQVVWVEMERARLAKFGISPGQIQQILQAHNAVVSSGKVDVDGEYIRISPSGEFADASDIANLLIGNTESQIHLSDVATVRKGYEDPPGDLMLYNGKPAIGFGISTVAGGNVVTMGEVVKKRLADLDANRPVGMELHSIYYQSDEVTEAVNIFMTNLVEAVAIVVVLLMLFMGWQSGLLIGAVLLLTILATFFSMLVFGIDLQKVSLGALILALGMLVDNAIVVAEGVLVRVQRGEDRESAAISVVRDTQWPLFGATIVAILAFTAIGFAPGNVGEFCRSMFYVMALSLLISWLLAVTITPLFCVWFLKVPKLKEGADPYHRPMFRIYRSLLHLSIRLRWLVVPAVVLTLGLAIFGFKYVPKGFFMDSTKRLFYVNYWKPQGTHIDETTADLVEIQKHVREMDGVENVTTVVGSTAMRFMLSYVVELPNTSFGQLLVEVDDYHHIGDLSKKIERYLSENYPDSEPYSTKVPNGPAVSLKVEGRFRGPDVKVLEKLSQQALEMVRSEPDARDIRTDWRQETRVIRPVFSESQARRAGVTRSDLAQALQWNFTGITVGVHREGDDLLPIISRAPESERVSVNNLGDVQVWSSGTQNYLPIRQVVSGMETVWEHPLIIRRDRQRSISVQCNPTNGTAEDLRLALAPKFASIDLPVGYSFEWGGEFEDSSTARGGIAKTFPVCLLGMFLVVVWLFNSIRRPLIIFLTLPLAVIGVTGALVATQLAFGFMSILGFLGLSGMMIKNAIVLIDQIELDRQEGKHPYAAVLDSGVSRLRPVVMAAGTTILGMAPLITDPLYASMAATIMGGLFVATFLTLVLVPIFYCMFFRIKPHLPEKAAE